MGDPDGGSNLPLGGSVAESQKTLRRIVDVWIRAVRDPVPAIRVLTILVTVVGFVAVLVFLIALLSVVASVNSGKPIELQLYVYSLLALFFVLCVSSIPVTFSLTSRAQAAVLDVQFASVAKRAGGGIARAPKAGT